MKEIKNFDINIYHLKEGQHQYQYEIKDSFFQLFDNSLLNHGNIEVALLLTKQSTFVELVFEIVGGYQLTCDRSLENFIHQFSAHNKVILKFGNEDKELDEDIYMIEHDTQRINVSQWIYEFITLSIPMKKIHPDLAGELDDVELGKIIYSSEEESEPTDSEEAIDPRWLKLKNLKK